MSVAALCLSFMVAAAEPSLLEGLERFDKKLDQTLQALRQSQQKSQVLEEKLVQLRGAYATVADDATQTQRRYRRRLSVLSRSPAEPGLTTAAQSGSYGDYVESNRVLKYVAQHDRRLLAQLQARQHKLRTLQQQLEEQQQQLQAALAARLGDEAALAQHRRGREAYLHEVQFVPQNAPALAAERTAAQRALSQVVAATGGAPAPAAASPPAVAFASLRGRLPPPASGALRTAFGERVELAFGTVTAHHGWDIGAPAHAPVHAVAGGTVAFAGWLRGYGQLVVLDHQQDYHTIHAHLASLQVSEGQSVEAGDLLGTVGDSGSLRGTVLYFEIRHRGTPLDPRAWLRREAIDMPATPVQKK